MIAAPTAVFCAWLLFAGTHVLFGFPPLRNRLAMRLGEQRFVAAFSAVAAVSLGILAAVVWRFGGEGPVGPGHAMAPTARVALATLATLGLLLAVAALPAYPRSPMALFRTGFKAPTGIARVSRHAFFVGMTVFASAHALLAPTLAQSLYLLGFAVLALVGAIAQDRKLLQRYGLAYADYMAVTSVLPFVAILRGRQRLSRDDRLPQALLHAGTITLLVLLTHPLWAAFNGALFAGAMSVGGVFLSMQRWRTAHGWRTSQSG